MTMSAGAPRKSPHSRSDARACGADVLPRLRGLRCDVIKIEAPPGVDPNEGMSGARDGSDMQNLHRNKRSITLNLKSPAGLAVFKRLVATRRCRRRELPSRREGRGSASPMRT